MDSAEDEMARGYHGIPSEEELKALSPIALAEALATSHPGSTKHIVLSDEKRRRDSAHEVGTSEIAGANAQKDRQKRNEKSVGFVGLTVSAVVAGLILIAVQHFFHLL